LGGAYEVEIVGSTTTTTRYYAIPYGNDVGGLVSQQRFLPFGQLRGATPTVAGSARARIRFVETVKPNNLYFLLPVGQLVL
jgi:hypothetical protein